MSNFRLTCIVRNPDDYRNRKEVIVEDRHPDLCKQRVERKYPKHEMLDIKIEDLRPPPSSWDRKPGKPSDPVRHKSGSGINRIDRVWEKELAR